MAALGLSLALFAYWLAIGYAFVSVLNTRRNTLRNVLLAPAVGAASTVLPVFLLNRAGVAVSGAGLPVLIALSLISGGLMWRTRPPVPWRQFAPFGAALFAALILVGRPMLDFGFDWISYANDDMANYVLGANFFLENAYPNVPDTSRLVDGSDYSLFYWFFYVPHAVRPGSEMLLAWVVSLTGLTGHQAFMPLIVSMHLALISAAAGLVLRSPRDRLTAWVTAALVAVSALTTFATLSELLGQIGGLAILSALAALVLRPMHGAGTACNVRIGALVGGLGAALLIVYPEVLPLLGLAFLVYTAVGLLRGKVRPQAYVQVLGAALLTGLLLTNTYLVDAALFMSIQLNGGLRPSDPYSFIFPYFLLPSGLADFWGFQSIGNFASEPYRSLSIAVGAGLLVFVCFQAARLAWRGQPGATLALVMLAFAATLFARSIDFGLFKLAMFAQPFVLGTLAYSVCRSVPRRFNWGWLPVLVAAAAGIAGQLSYVEKSRGQFNEVPFASQSHINADFQHVLQSVKPQQVVLDTINISLAKFQALYTRGLDANFPSRDFFSYIIGRDLRNQVIVPGTFDNARMARDAVDSRFLPAFFNLHEKSDSSAVDEFRINSLGQSSTLTTDCDAFIGGTAIQSVFNRRHSDPSDSTNFSVTPCRDIHNHLIFVHSKLGQHYYQVDQHYFGEDRPTISIYRLESDPVFAGLTMAGVGRYLLFEVVGAAPRVRLALELTATLKADGENLLPPASVIGEDRVAFPLLGRGDSRVFSPPVSPQLINGHTYIAIDMGVDGKRFTDDHGGLMALYGTNIPYDRRELVGFARDISAIGDDEYSQLSPPRGVQQFPADLRNQSLQYSGVYEDGWVSEAAFFDLSQPANASLLSIRGMLPLVDDPAFTSSVQVLLDGRPLAQQALQPGDFHITASVPHEIGRHRVDLRFSRLQRLPAPDLRPVASLLRSIGFESTAIGAADNAPDEIVGAHSGIVLVGDGWYPLEKFAGETFRWVNNDAEIVTTTSGAQNRRLAVDLEPGPGVGGKRFDLHFVDGDGRELASVPVAGRQSVTIPVPESTGPSATIRVHVDEGGLPAPNDARTLNFRVFRLSWEDGP